MPVGDFEVVSQWNINSGKWNDHSPRWGGAILRHRPTGVLYAITTDGVLDATGITVMLDRDGKPLVSER